MEALTLTNPALLPGQRLLSVKGGFESADKYPTPRDTVVAIFDEDEDYVYVKTTDVNGSASIRRFKLTEEPIPKFDPKLYVTIDDFRKLQEEVRDGFSSLQQSITSSVSGATRSNGTNNGNNKPSQRQQQSGADI